MTALEILKEHGELSFEDIGKFYGGVFDYMKLHMELRYLMTKGLIKMRMNRIAGETRDVALYSVAN